MAKKELNKNQKMVLLVAPIILILLGSLMYYKFSKSDDQVISEELTEDQMDLSLETENKDTKKLTPLERARLRRNQRNDENSITQSDFYSLGETSETNFEEEEPEDTVVPEPKQNFYAVEEKPKEEPKPKVIYKTIYKEVPKQEAPVEVAPEPVKVARTRSRGSSLGNFQETGNYQADTKMVKCYVDNDNKKIQSGSDVRVVTANNSVINGINVPAGTTVIGKASVNKSRVYVTVTEVILGGQALAVNLTAYDVNGTRGIKVNTSAVQEVKDQTAKDVTRQARGLNVNVPITGGSINLGNGIQRAEKIEQVILIDRHVIYLR